MASAVLGDDKGETCKASRKCSKPGGHKGRCNSKKRVNSFWESSNVYKLNIRKRKLLDDEERFDRENESKVANLQAREEQLTAIELEFRKKLTAKGK